MTCPLWCRLQSSSKAGESEKRYEYLLPVASTLHQECLRQQVAAQKPLVRIQFTDNSRVTLRYARAQWWPVARRRWRRRWPERPFVVV